MQAEPLGEIPGGERGRARLDQREHARAVRLAERLMDRERSGHASHSSDAHRAAPRARPRSALRGFRIAVQRIAPMLRGPVSPTLIVNSMLKGAN
jgi:hypothetical protein